VPTTRLNALLAEIQAAHPHPVRSGKAARILFGTQASTRPPRFVLFTTGFFEAQYRRFVERRLREAFGFAGTPIEVSVRPREKRRANPTHQMPAAARGSSVLTIPCRGVRSRRGQLDVGDRQRNADDRDRQGRWPSHQIRPESRAAKSVLL